MLGLAILGASVSLLDQCFQEIVRAPMLSIYHKHPSVDELESLINRGQGPFDRKESVYAYCLRLMYHHYDDYKAVLASINYEPPSDRSTPIGMLDFGCGPATAAFAVADYISEKYGYVPVLHYAGIDIYPDMLSVAGQFLEVITAGGSRGEFRLAKTTEDLRPALAIGKLPHQAHTLVSASYIFSQSLSTETVRSFAELTSETVKNRAPNDAWFIGLNIDAAAGGLDDHFRSYQDCCQQQGVLLPPSMGRLTSSRRYPATLYEGKFFAGRPSKPGNVCYTGGRIIVETQPCNSAS